MEHLTASIEPQPTHIYAFTLENFNPQPDPPGKEHPIEEFNPQPDPPGKPLPREEFNPQPDPPGRHIQ